MVSLAPAPSSPAGWYKAGRGTARRARSGTQARRLTLYLWRIAREAGGELRSVVRATSETHRRLRDRLTLVVVATVVVDLACAVLALAFEQHAKGTQIHGFGSALFWTSTQLLTVSSSLANPLTMPGRILDVGMELYAITVVATLAGSLGTFMIRRAEERERR